MRSRIAVQRWCVRMRDVRSANSNLDRLVVEGSADHCYSSSHLFFSPPAKLINDEDSSQMFDVKGSHQCTEVY